MHRVETLTPLRVEKKKKLILLQVFYLFFDALRFFFERLLVFLEHIDMLFLRQEASSASAGSTIISHGFLPPPSFYIPAYVG